jgi:hypothetical protein
MLNLETIRDGLSSPTVQWTLAVVLPFTLYRLCLTLWRPAFDSKTPATIHEGIPIIGSFRFWSARWEFFKKHGKGKNFSFYVGSNRVIAVRGHAARQDFFNNRELDFSKG